jgi:hypothetical protein
MLVVAVPLQRTRFKHRPPQGSQTLGVTAPQGVPFAQVAAQLNVPPHASPTPPQYCWTPLALVQLTSSKRIAATVAHGSAVLAT